MMGLMVSDAKMKVNNSLSDVYTHMYTYLQYMLFVENQKTGMSNANVLSCLYDGFD